MIFILKLFPYIHKNQLYTSLSSYSPLHYVSNLNTSKRLIHSKNNNNVMFHYLGKCIQFKRRLEANVGIC